jgi:hypothetical protein
MWFFIYGPVRKHILHLKKLLQEKGIQCEFANEKLICSSDKKQIALSVPEDLIVTAGAKLAALIQSRLGLNKKVFARKCSVQKVSKELAEAFLDRYHLMNSTQSAYNYGLFLEDELVAVASFSKGRKMNRLPDDKRSYELIRFCCKDGITVTGGLTKLLNFFCIEKKAGDVMTYIDKQFSEGESFVKAGFVKHNETAAHYFLINKSNFMRTPVKEKDVEFDKTKFYLLESKGNVKLVYTPTGK